MSGQPRVAFCVALGSISQSVIFSIDLDRKSGSEAKEIQHIRADRVLPTESIAGNLTFAKRVPQIYLGLGHVPPKFPRFLNTHVSSSPFGGSDSASAER